MNDIAPDQTSPIDVMSKPRPPKGGGSSSLGHGAASAGSVGHKRSAVKYDAGDGEEDGSNKAARIVGEWTLPSLPRLICVDDDTASLVSSSEG
jgi:hypothetical protein